MKMHCIGYDGLVQRSGENCCQLVFTISTLLCLLCIWLHQTTHHLGLCLLCINNIVTGIHQVHVIQYYLHLLIILITIMNIQCSVIIVIVQQAQLFELLLTGDIIVVIRSLWVIVEFKSEAFSSSLYSLLLLSLSMGDSNWARLDAINYHPWLAMCLQDRLCHQLHLDIASNGKIRWIKLWGCRKCLNLPVVYFFACKKSWFCAVWPWI